MEVKKREPVLTADRHMLAQHQRNVWVANAEYGTTVDDVLQPAYWAHVSDKLREFDYIEVRIDSGEWLLQLLVVARDRGWAKVKLLHRYDIAMVDDEAPAEARHAIKFMGPHWKWCVIRKSDGEPILKGFDKAQAFAELERFEQRLAA